MSKFKTGRFVMTAGISAKMDESQDFSSFVFNSLTNKYLKDDWGNICEEDKQSNDQAVNKGERILAVYTYPETNEDIWIITEADRSVTTILFPSEY